MTKKTFLAIAIALAGCSEDDPSDTRVTPAATETGAETDTGSTIDTSVTNDSSAAEVSTETGDTALDTPDVATDTKPIDAGTAADCIDATAMDPYFTLMDTTKCLVAKYEVATGYLGSLSWGRHGGPLGFQGGPTPKIVRYQVPATATGTITAMSTDVPVSAVPSGAFWGGAAVDLPFFGWTAFSYTATGTGFPGEVVLVSSSGDLTRYHVNGFFSAVGIGLSTASGGRLIHTSVSPISATAISTNAGGLYAADSCGSPSTTPRLLPDGDSSCKAPIEIATWEAGSSGPIAVDQNENLFAILSKFGGKQELRGFERSTVARGATPTTGTKIFSRDGYTQELVADGKAVYFQAYDATTYSALDVETIGYTVAAKNVTPSGDSSVFLKMKTAGTAVSLVRDELGRLWVGVAAPGTGDAGPTSSVFFVLRAKTP